MFRFVDEFLISHLTSQYSENGAPSTWLTGGMAQPTSSRFVWYVSGRRSDVTMTYVNNRWRRVHEPPKWAESVVLRRIPTGNATEYEWSTVTMETNVRRQDRIAYPFICEAKANSK